MIRKEYQVGSTLSKEDEDKVTNSNIKNEIIRMIDTAFLNGAIVELKILEGVDLVNGGKRFSKIRMDIVSNTDFDKYEDL
ncbi:hypothetical protein GCM10023093_06750 [Nemorincola caseinilytica]|uniref:Uncharacterized protein n=1 Tax=Nemorincola caseinilytica TaxID=2054315 RepID=A0ABP8N5I1_9BACT